MDIEERIYENSKLLELDVEFLVWIKISKKLKGFGILDKLSFWLKGKKERVSLK